MHSNLGSSQQEAPQTFRGLQQRPSSSGQTLPLGQHCVPPPHICRPLGQTQRLPVRSQTASGGQQRPPHFARFFGHVHVCSRSLHTSFGSQHSFAPHARSFGQHVPFSARQRSVLRSQQSADARPRWPGIGSKAQHSRSGGQHRLIVLPAAQRECVAGQHLPISSNAQNSPGTQHVVPHGTAPGWSQGLHVAAIGPGPQLPSGRHWEPFGLHGLQQETSVGHCALPPSGPTQQIRSCGQQVGKQLSLALVQYFQLSSRTRPSQT